MPQGRHLHGLLLRGAQALDELFPGFLDEIVADGAACFDGSDLSRLYFCMNGHLGVRSGSSQQISSLSLLGMPRSRENGVGSPADADVSLGV